MEASGNDEINISSSTIDVEAAIRFILGTRRHTRRQSGPASGSRSLRSNFILKHQIYCIVENIAEVCYAGQLKYFSDADVHSSFY
jgi:hypothetical protein